MKVIFKKGDRVYCVINGHGVVVDIEECSEFPVRVDTKNESDIGYTHDGRYYKHSTPTLSLTEYTLQGFSQERPIELPEFGELCLVKDFKDSVWKAREFKKFTTHFLDTSGERWDEFKRIKILD